MLISDRLAVVLSDIRGRQHPRRIYYRPQQIEASANDLKYVRRLLVIALWFIAPFLIAFGGAILYALTLAISE